MKVKSVRTVGNGRGKLLGFPTINLKIPPQFNVPFGIYVAQADIADKQFKAALHFGPVPTFDQPDPSLEVFLLDATSADIPDLSSHPVTVTLVKWLRGIVAFSSNQDLQHQIEKDVKEVRQFFSKQT